MSKLSRDFDKETILRLQEKLESPLFAAAPEMLEVLYDALIYIEDALYNPAFKTGVVQNHVNKIRAVIAKAEGKVK